MEEKSLEDATYNAWINIKAQRNCETCTEKLTYSYPEKTVEGMYKSASSVIRRIARVTPKEYWKSDETKPFSPKVVRENLKITSENKEKTQIYFSALEHYKDKLLPYLKKYQIATIVYLLQQKANLDQKKRL